MEKKDIIILLLAASIASGLCPDIPALIRYSRESPELAEVSLVCYLILAVIVFYTIEKVL